jgi:site-specific DNA recombinase
MRGFIMKKVALYARVSTSKQKNVIEGSIKTQLSKLKQFVDMKVGMEEEEWVIVDEYVDEGFSGESLDRPAMERLKKDIESKKVDAIVTYKIDRLSRNLRDFLGFQEDYINKYDVAFVSMVEKFDTSTAIGRCILSILLTFAQFEREQSADRTRDKMQWRAEKGFKNGGQILGYDNDSETKTYLVNKNEKELVLLIFNTYSKLGGLKRTAQYINKMGYTTKSYISRNKNYRGGKFFTSQQISRILSNKFYIGKIEYDGNVYEGRHDAIVPSPLWENVQMQKEKNKRNNSKPRKQNSHVFLLQGLVKCKECGCVMTTEYGTGKGGKTYCYYKCTCQRNSGGICNMRPASATELERIMEERLMEIACDPKYLRCLAEDSSTNSIDVLNELKAKDQNLKGLKRKIEQQINNLIVALGDGVEIPSVKAKIQDLESERKDALKSVLENQKELESLKRKVVSVQELSRTLTTFKKLYTKADLETKKKLMRMYINQIFWSPDCITYEIMTAPDRGCFLVNSVQPVGLFGDPEGSRTPVTRLRI